MPRFLGYRLGMTLRNRLPVEGRFGSPRIAQNFPGPPPDVEDFVEAES
jgi:hypothetical protein